MDSCWCSHGVAKDPTDVRERRQVTVHAGAFLSLYSGDNMARNFMYLHVFYIYNLRFGGGPASAELREMIGGQISGFRRKRG